MAISALRQVAPLALADAPAGSQGGPVLHWSTAEVEPKAELSTSIGGLHDLVAMPFGDHTLLGPLLESCFADLTEADDRDPATARAMAPDPVPRSTAISRPRNVNPAPTSPGGAGTGS